MLLDWTYYYAVVFFEPGPEYDGETDHISVIPPSGFRFSSYPFEPSPGIGYIVQVQRRINNVKRESISSSRG